MRVLRVSIVAAAFALLASPGSAHPVPFSYLDLHVERGVIDGTLVAHIFDLAHDLTVDPPERLLEAGVAAARGQAMIDLLSPRLAVMVDGRQVTARWSGIEAIPDRQSIRFHLSFALAAPAGVVAVDAHLFPYDPNHQTFLNVYEGEALTQAILDQRRPRFE